jgi:hypothetical protein
MKPYLNLLYSFLFVVAGVAAEHFRMSAVALLCGVGALVFFPRSFRLDTSEARAVNQSIDDARKNLRESLVETHRHLLLELGTVYTIPEEELQTKIIELLVEAGKHLGHPYTNSRGEAGTSDFLTWTEEGAALVAQARQLIDEYKFPTRDRAGGELH